MKNMKTAISLLSLFCAAGLGLQAQTQVLSSNNITLTARSASDNIIEGQLLDDYGTLKRAIRKTRLDRKLTQVPAYTVFAPTDQAFFELPGETFTELLTSDDGLLLENTLRYHLIPGKWDSIEIIKALCNDDGVAEVQTFHGDTLKFKVQGMRVFLIDAAGGSVEILQDSSKVVESGGIVIHPISRVMSAPVYD